MIEEKFPTPEQAENVGMREGDASRFITAGLLASLLHERPVFAHKGLFGHALLIAGSRGMTGAVQLAAKACLRSGVGLLTLHVPASACVIVQTAVPEAMAECDAEADRVSSLNLKSLAKYTAAGIGPGLGRSEEAARCLKQLLQFYRRPILCDADALNILSENPTWMEFLPAGSVLTPHIGELERLVGSCGDAFERLEKTKILAARHRCVCLIKGAFTAVVCPDGQVFFNTTGNPGMATGGSGDVLSGIILSFLAQGYPAVQAAVAGVFLHGLAGDLALADESEESLLAGDIVSRLGKAFKALKASPIG